MMADGFKTQSYQLHVPDHKVVADLFQSKLGQYFGSVTASVVQCPDLTLSPFHLAHSGLTGREAICDVSMTGLTLILFITTSSYACRWEECHIWFHWHKRIAVHTH